ncbi:3,9-dihydroxypterocarpan 6A-monooxygenase-like [Mercurialis annua]|uniref:3,9-dihydroxypterocarpan 6A-monooxygenase-like n=1 Tax=Mercurialis annua TaxID=3986 RepID=UPI00215EFFB0|nr:3,9-dihydroxypterocarpan 6A-monooxygenase-like [Mercurialis annua]
MVSFQDSMILLIIWLVSMIIVRAILTKLRAKPRLPPSPLALPIIGHLHLLSPILHQSLHKLSTRYGPLIHLRLGSVPCVVASSPEMAKEFLKTHETSFLNRPVMSAVDYLTYGSADFSFSPYGPYWKFMKKLCMTELLGGRILDQFVPVRHEEIKGFLQFMMKKANAGEAVNVGVQLLRVTNNVVSKMLMNHRCSENEDEADEVRKLVQEIAALTASFNLSDFIWFCKSLDLQGFGTRLKQVRDKFDNLMDKIIREHEEARKKTGYEGDKVKDVLHILLDIQGDDNSEIKLTTENIKSFIMDIFTAGTDTSAITTEWALAELINHPEIMNKARQEIDSVIGMNRLVQESDITNLPYVQAIVKETLRLHPTGPMTVRESTEDCVINGYEIPARTRLFVNIWALGRDPNYWENPLDFVPERFMNVEVNVRGQHFHYLPFGSGRRGCPGTSLALQMVQSSLAAMIQCFDWKVDGSVDMEEGPGITLPRANPLICVPVERIKPIPLF